MAKPRHSENSIPEIIWLEKAAEILDSKFKLPGTTFRFGLDPIIGLIPIAGNLATMFISACLLFIMSRYGASRKVVLLMTLNILVDTVVGAIPILGNLFDFAFKSNNRNIKLLKAHYFEAKHEGSGVGIIILIVTLFLIVAGGLIWGIFMFFSFLIHLIQGIHF